MREFSPSDATILLLDSEPAMRAAFHDLLQRAGYWWKRQATWAKPLTGSTSLRPDLLITRPYINSMPGRIAANYLRSKSPGLPVLIVSGFMDDDRLRVQNAIEKFYTFPEPLNHDQLLAKVKEVLHVVHYKA